MINIKNLSITYGKQRVVDSLSIQLPNKGVIAFVGPSGCGKSSILHAISGLLDYQGSIEIDNINLKKLSVTQSNNFRLKNIGFIFQDFKLFELDNVENNISLPLDIATGLMSYRNKERVNDLLRLVDIYDKRKQLVKNLSGGEKQRVAIARSLVNNPKLILADEPTGALDDNNANLIMEILTNIAKDRLVIVVSHDIELIRKYANKILYLNDGKIEKIYCKNRDNYFKSLQLINKQYHVKHHHIPLRFLFKHTVMHIKEKKWRTTLISMVTSLGLIGVGLAVSLSSSISENIKKACSSFLSDDQIIVTSNVKEFPLSIVAKSYEEMYDIKLHYPSEIKDIGAIYKTNFQTHFKSEDNFSIYSKGTNVLLNSYNSHHINEFSWLDESSDEFYPEKPIKLSDSEIVMNLSLGQVYDICYQLHINRTVESFVNYLRNNEVNVVHSVKNDDWGYLDQHIYTLKAFRLDYTPKIYHLNHLWNEIVFEQEMRMPSTPYINAATYYPWTMKKIYYFEVDNDKRDSFLAKVKYDSFTSSSLFEIASNTYFPFTYDSTSKVKDISKVLVFHNSLEKMSLPLVDQIENISSHIDGVTLGSNASYLILPEALMMGFSTYTYLSNDYHALEDTLDKLATTDTRDNESLTFDNNIIVGHYSKSMQNGLIFKQIPRNLTFNYDLSSLDNVVISKGIINQLHLNNPHQLSLGVIVNEQTLNNGKTYREYKIVDLNVIGIIDSEDNIIYQERDWLINFYQCRVGRSIFDLGIDAVSFTLDKDADKEIEIAKIKHALPSYNVTNPLNDINKSIDEVCGYIELVLFIFSLTAILISTFLLGVCNYLHALEVKKDIGLSRCLGVGSVESTKFVFIHAYTMGLISLAISSIELLFFNVVIEKVISNHLQVSFSFSFNPLAILYMFLLTLVVTSISSIFISIKVNRFSPLEAIKDI